MGTATVGRWSGLQRDKKSCGINDTVWSNLLEEWGWVARRDEGEGGEEEEKKWNWGWQRILGEEQGSQRKRSNAPPQILGSNGRMRIGSGADGDGDGAGRLTAVGILGTGARSRWWRRAMRERAEPRCQ